MPASDPTDNGPLSGRWGRRHWLLPLAGRLLLLAVAAVALYLLAPQLLAVFASAPQLSRVEWPWLAVMFALEAASFSAAWGLARLAVPGLRWPVAATAQLAANAASRAVPGGVVVGGAVYFRLLRRSGVEPSGAAAALTANSLISNMVLFALPAAGAFSAAVTAAVPRGLLPVALAGLGLFVLTLGIGAVLVRFDWPLGFAGVVAERVSRLVPHRLFRGRVVRRDALLRTRNDLVDAMGGRWWQAVGFAAANWILDYLVLVAALRAIGAEPRLSLVLLAYGAASVLGMIPLTPGGLGFVEAGLTATLTVAGIAAGDALLATLAYRLFSFWLAIPAGAVAYGIHRRWLRTRPDEPNSAQRRV
ncbi:MAG: lysylphosphatidylglycerol synthase transmembrane domain-containing protein [Actinomycetota bacterium]